jgi:hypothetical protein
MNTHKPRDPEAVLAEVALTGVSLRKAEEEWKALRAHSRKLTLELVTEQGVSVAKAASLTGHTRQTIKIWLNVHNAEHKAAQKKN